MLSGCEHSKPSTPTPAPVSSQPLPAQSASDPVAQAARPAPTAQPAGPISVRLLAFNDFHGALEPAQPDHQGADDAAEHNGLRALSTDASPERGGITALAGLIHRERSATAHHLTLSVGDLIGASPLPSALLLDEPTIRLMNTLGLDANVLGNHEFDRGQAELQRLIDGGCQPRGPLPAGRKPCGEGLPYPGASFPFISANITDRRTERPAYATHIIKRFQGVPVAVIGATLKGTPGIVARHAVSNLSFGDEAAGINRVVKTLRADGVQTFIAAIHEGGRISNPSKHFNDCSGLQGAIVPIVRKLDPAIRIVLTAHTHHAYRCEIDGRLVTSAGAHGRYLTRIDLRLNPQDGTLEPGSVRAENVPVITPARAGAQPSNPNSMEQSISRLLREVLAKSRPLAERPVATLVGPIQRAPDDHGQSQMGAVVADAYLAATKGAGAVMAFTNPGGLRQDLHPAADGRVNFGQVFAVQPFGNTLVTMTVDGATIRQIFHKQLLAQLQQAGGRRPPRLLQVSTGVVVRYDPSALQSPRGLSIQLQGQPLRDDGNYRITVTDYLADGGGGLSALRSGRDRVGGRQDVDALMDWLASQTPFQPPRDQRMQRFSHRPTAAAPSLAPDRPVLAGLALGSVPIEPEPPTR